MCHHRCHVRTHLCSTTASPIAAGATLTFRSCLQVPNLLQPADLAAAFENMRPMAKQAGMDGNRDSMYAFFLQQVRVLAMRQAGSS